MNRCRFFLIAVLITGFGYTVAANAQEKENDQVEAEVSEELAEQLAAEIEERAEAWAERQEEQWENWAEQQSEVWEDWAQDYEQHWEQWAEEHEKVWEAWAEEYEEKWESWAEDLESGDFSPEQLRDMFRHNMEMLGDMPLEEMYRGILKNTARLEDAPWEQLADIEELVRDSIDSALQELESVKDLHRHDGDHDGDVDDADLRTLHKSLAKLHSELDAARSDLAQAARQNVEELRGRLHEIDELDDPQERQTAIEAAVKEYRQAARQKQRDQRSRERTARQRQARDAADHARAMRDRLLRDVEQDQDRIKSSNEEIRALRSEVEELRRELEQLKQDKREGDEDNVI